MEKKIEKLILKKIGRTAVVARPIFLIYINNTACFARKTEK